MELSNSFFDSSLTNFGNFVQVVVSCNDEEKKTKLVEQLNQFLELASPPIAAKKRSNDFDSKIIDKKIKLDSRTMDVPNELWTKIMNYLPTNEIFKNFGLACKRFRGLTSGIIRLHAQIPDPNLSDIVLKIVKNSRAIIALDLEILYQNWNNYFQFETVSENLIKEAINSCQKLKSLRISGDYNLKRDLIEILKKFGPQFEHLKFESLGTTSEVFVEIGTLAFLKSLSLRSLNVRDIPANSQQRKMMVEIVQNLIKNATQLESIDFEFGSDDPEITNLYNKLINEKKHTLRKIGLTKQSRRYSNCENVNSRSHCVSFGTINQCTNLEELSGILHIHEFLDTKLKRLLTGKINHLDDLFKFSQMNRINLEHIEVEMNSEWFAYFAQLEYLALRYLMINLENYTDYQYYLKHEDLDTLIKNSPNLKALRFNGIPVVRSTESRFKIFETKGVIIEANDTLQDDLEMTEYFYTNQKDLLVFEKYKSMKTLYMRQFSNFQSQD